MIVKFITMKGASGIAAAPYYVGFVQHDRTMSRRETYAYCAERTGFKAAAIRAVFMALAEFIGGGLADAIEARGRLAHEIGRTHVKLRASLDEARFQVGEVARGGGGIGAVGRISGCRIGRHGTRRFGVVEAVDGVAAGAQHFLFRDGQGRRPRRRRLVDRLGRRERIEEARLAGVRERDPPACNVILP